MTQESLHYGKGYIARLEGRDGEITMLDGRTATFTENELDPSGLYCDDLAVDDFVTFICKETNLNNQLLTDFLSVSRKNSRGAYMTLGLEGPEQEGNYRGIIDEFDAEVGKGSIFIVGPDVLARVAFDASVFAWVSDEHVGSDVSIQVHTVEGVLVVHEMRRLN